MKHKCLAFVIAASCFTIYTQVFAADPQSPIQNQMSPNPPMSTVPQPPTTNPPMTNPPATATPVVPQPPVTNNANPPPTNQTQAPSNSVQGTDADGQKRMTVIDENGNLKMVEVPGPDASQAIGSESSTGGAQPAPQPSPPTPDSSNLNNPSPMPQAPRSQGPQPPQPSNPEPSVPVDNSQTQSNLNNINQPSRY